VIVSRRLALRHKAQRQRVRSINRNIRSVPTKRAAGRPYRNPTAPFFRPFTGSSLRREESAALFGYRPIRDARGSPKNPRRLAHLHSKPPEPHKKHRKES
jgi:hypothetical protein